MERVDLERELTGAELDELARSLLERFPMRRQFHSHALVQRTPGVWEATLADDLPHRIQRFVVQRESDAFATSIHVEERLFGEGELSYPVPAVLLLEREYIRDLEPLWPGRSRLRVCVEGPVVALAVVTERTPPSC